MAVRLGAIEAAVESEDHPHAASLPRHPQFIDTAEVCRLLGKSRMTLSRWEADPSCRFPRPFKIRARKYWLRRRVIDYMEGLASAADSPNSDFDLTPPALEDSGGQAPSALALRERAARLVAAAEALAQRLLAAAEAFDAEVRENS